MTLALDRKLILQATLMRSQVSVNIICIGMLCLFTSNMLYVFTHQQGYLNGYYGT